MKTIQKLPKAKKYVFFSDVHGAIQKLNQMMTIPEWYDEPDTHFVFLGDMIDGYGSDLDFKATINFFITWQDKITAVLGNHDQMLLEAADKDVIDYEAVADWIFHNGGKQTLRNLGYHHAIAEYNPRHLQKINDFLNEKYANELDYLRSLPLIVHNNRIIGVHAGVNLEKWQDTTPKEALWSRSNYYYTPDGEVRANPTNRVIVSGHTPVQNEEIFPTNQGDNLPIYLRNQHEKPRVIIDGGCSSDAPNAVLNLLALTQRGYYEVNIQIS